MTDATGSDDFGLFEDTEDEQTIEMGPESLGGSRQVRSRDSALDDGLPLLLMHRERNYHRSLPKIIDQLHKTNAASLSLGLVVNLPRVKPDDAELWLMDSCAASVRIADPELYTRPDMWGEVLLQEQYGRPRPDEAPKELMPKTTTPLWDYWTQTLASGPTEEWVKEVIDSQRQAGANLLLTPGTPLDQYAPGPALDELERQVSWSRGSIGNGERLAVNITIDWSWLANPALRNSLLNMVVESDEATWYIRVKWPLQQGAAEPIDASLLDGYRELATFMEDEERKLLLPTTGGTGWVSLAWGACGFGTGIGTGSRGFVTKRPIRRTGPVPPAQPRYYERPILHTVEKTTADSLARVPGYAACTCTYCLELRDRPTWDGNLHGCHYLLAVGEQTAALAAGPARRQVARRMVKAACRKRDEVASRVLLTGRDAPSHLDLWQERLL